MDFYAVLDEVLHLLQRHKRVTYRALKRQFGLDDAYRVRISDHADEEAEADQLSFDEIFFSVRSIVLTRIGGSRGGKGKNDADAFCAMPSVWWRDGRERRGKTTPQRQAYRRRESLCRSLPAVWRAVVSPRNREILRPHPGEAEAPRDRRLSTAGAIVSGHRARWVR